MEKKGKGLHAIREELRNLLSSQTLGVLGTRQDGQPYTSLVAFASSDDIKYLFFATTRATRKFANLSSDSRVAMLIDNRSNHPSDLRFAMAVTATGRAEEIQKHASADFLAIYLSKHPHLKDFVSSPSSALISIRVEIYYLVTRFQNVVEIHLT